MRNLLTRPLVWSVPFLASALYHLLAIVIPGFGEPSPNIRHAVFIGIGLGMAWLAYRGGWMFLTLLSLLTLQQLYSHGIYMHYVWQYEARIDWWSVLTMLGLPVMVALFTLYRRPQKA